MEMRNTDAATVTAVAYHLGLALDAAEAEAISDLLRLQAEAAIRLNRWISPNLEPAFLRSPFGGTRDSV